MTNKEFADRVIVEYMEKIYGFALSKMVNIDHAEELSARIIFEVYKALLKKGYVENVNSYIYRISHNVYSRYIAEEMKNKSLSQKEYQAPCEYDLEKDEVCAQIRRRVAYLSQTQRKITVMHYYDLMKLSEIAEKLDLPLSTVKWHIQEARNQIKNDLVEKKENSINQKYIEFSHMMNYGYLGLSNITMPFYFTSKITQNVAYSAYKKPKTAVEIANDITVPTAFVEDIIDDLVDNGFMKKMPYHKYLTNIYITDSGKKIAEKLKEIATKYAEIVCDMYIPLLFDVGNAFMRSVSALAGNLPPILSHECRERFGTERITAFLTNKKIYSPKNDFNFLMWSIVSFACWKKLNYIDSHYDELHKFMIKRKDGGNYIAMASIANESNSDDKSMELLTIKDLYPFTTWQFLTKFDQKSENLADWKFLYISLYKYLTGEITKEPSNIGTFKRLYDHGLVVSNRSKKGGDITEYINIVLTSLSETELTDLLPPIPEELKSLGKKLDEERYITNKEFHPSHDHDLCRVLCQNTLASGGMRVHVLECLLRRGVLKPLKKMQKKTVNMIMFL